MRSIGDTKGYLYAFDEISNNLSKKGELGDVEMADLFMNSLPKIP